MILPRPWGAGTGPPSGTAPDPRLQTFRHAHGLDQAQHQYKPRPNRIACHAGTIDGDYGISTGAARHMSQLLSGQLHVPGGWLPDLDQAHAPNACLAFRRPRRAAIRRTSSVAPIAPIARSGDQGAVSALHRPHASRTSERRHLIPVNRLTRMCTPAAHSVAGPGRQSSFAVHGECLLSGGQPASVTIEALCAGAAMDRFTSPISNDLPRHPFTAFPSSWPGIDALRFAGHEQNVRLSDFDVAFAGNGAPAPGSLPRVFVGGHTPRQGNWRTDAAQGASHGASVDRGMSHPWPITEFT